MAKRRVAEEMALAHRGLRAQFERIEQAVSKGDMRLGARLLNDLIGQARDHFINNEAIALGMGLSTATGGRLMRDAFVQRASRLMTRCLRNPANANDANIDDANTKGQAEIKDTLALLLSDLVESDLRIEQSISRSIEKSADPSV